MRAFTIIFALAFLSFFALSKAVVSPVGEQARDHVSAKISDEKIEGKDYTSKVGPFTVEIVSRPDELALGLSNREGILDGRGMLFVFGRDDIHYIWMKDMNFSIDIAWIDKDKHVVHIEKNVSPETFPKTFHSNVHARYVLEVGEGQLGKYSIEVGDTLVFSDF